MKSLRVKLVPYSLAFSICLLWHIRLIMSEPVESNAPAAPSTDTDSGKTIYDQRQTGKYNIHVSIKDVAIIEVDQNGIEDISYDDDEYYYDEEHITVKPILLNPNTTQKHSNITSTTTTRIPTTLSATQQSTIFLATSPETLTSTSDNQNVTFKLLTETVTTHNNKNKNILLPLLNFTSTTIPPNASKTGTQNVVILANQIMSHNSPTSTHKPTVSSTIRNVEINASPGIEPIPSTLPEGLLHASHTFSKYPNLRFVETSIDDNSSEYQQKEKDNDSKIFKFKVRRAQKQTPIDARAQAASLGYPISHLRAMLGKRCRRHQYRDANGGCRAKRSSSIL